MTRVARRHLDWDNTFQEKKKKQEEPEPRWKLPTKLPTSCNKHLSFSTFTFI